MTHDPHPSDELLAAAFQLRNPFHGAGLQVPVDTDLGEAIAELLEEDAQRLRQTIRPAWQELRTRRSLKVARIILQTHPEEGTAA